MGKVRAKTLGDEEQELKEKQEAEARRLAKIEAEKAKGQARKTSGAKAVEDEAEEPVAPSEETVIPNESEKSSEEISLDTRGDKEEKPAKKKTVQKVGQSKERSAKYKTSAAMIEKGKLYKLEDALELVAKAHLAKFDETVELHINTTAAINGSVTLPHGTGKSTKVAILAPSQDPKGADDLLKEIEAGKINFDILVATPDAMPRLAKVARILGPKGLMPNPKNGTVTPKPEEVAKQYAGGHMTFKTEAKAPVLHLSVGKLSFGQDKLSENIKAALKAVDMKNMRNVTLKSTMSPAIKLQVK